VLFPRIPLWDPNRVLKRWMPVANWIFSPLGGIVWLIVVITAIVLMVPQWGQFSLDYRNALSIGANPEKAAYLFIMFWLLKFCHEMGHAFSCRRFGGEVHEMGIMFLVFIPTPYVDASSAWAFPNRWARMFVGAGGMVVELFLAALAAFVYIATKPGVPVLGLPLRELMTDAIMIAGFTTIIFNANPLLRYDGYYMLSDWWEIPNLQQKSKEYLLGLIKRHVFRIKSQQPLPPVGQRIELLIYGLLSAAYRVFVGVAIILLVAWQVQVLGILMAIGGVATWIAVPVFQTFKYLALEPELHRKRGRATAFAAACIIAVVTLVGFIKFNVYVDAAGVVEPVAMEVLNARQGGFVTDIRVHDAQWVKQGDVLLVLDDDELDADIKRLQATLRGAKIKAEKSLNTGDMNQYKLDVLSLETTKTELATDNERKDELTVRAPIDGQVVAPDLKFLPNKYVPRGTELCRVQTSDKLVVRAVVEQRDIALANRQEEGDKMVLRRDPEIRLAGDVERVLDGGKVVLVHGGSARLPSKTLSVGGGGDITTDPRDQQGQFADVPMFEMRVDLANPKNIYVPGQRAWVRLTVGRKPLVWQWYNRFLQLIETKNKTSKWMQI